MPQKWARKWLNEQGVGESQTLYTETLLTAAVSPLVLVVDSALTPRGAGGTAVRAGAVGLRAVEAGAGAGSTEALGGSVGGGSDLLSGGGLVAVSASTVVVAALAPAVLVVVGVGVERRGSVGAEGALSLRLGTGGSGGRLGLAGSVCDGVGGGLAVDAGLGLAGPRVGGGEGAGGADDESATVVHTSVSVDAPESVGDTSVSGTAADDSDATVLDASGVDGPPVDGDVSLGDEVLEDGLLDEEDRGQGVK